MTRRYGAGTVYQRADGRWIGQWSAGRDEYGNRVRGTTTPTETEAAAWKALAAARGKSSSTRRRRGGETVGAFLERWLTDVVRPTRRERTLVGYRSIVDLHLQPTFGDRELRALTRKHIQAWVDTQPGAPLSIRHRVDCLRAAMSYAVRWGLIDANPASDLDLPSAPRRSVTALRVEDARALLEATSGTWFATLATVALYTGLRQGELLGLRWQDIDLKARSLTVHMSLARLPGTHGTRYVLDAPKSAHSRRTVPLADPVVDAITTLRREAMASDVPNPQHLVFYRVGPRGKAIPLDGTALTHDFQAALTAAKIEKMRWHDLRHATASLLIAQGVPLAVVSAILGHSGIAITVDVYGHLTEDTKRAAMDHMAAKMAAGA